MATQDTISTISFLGEDLPGLRYGSPGSRTQQAAARGGDGQRSALLLVYRGRPGRTAARGQLVSVNAQWWAAWTRQRRRIAVAPRGFAD